MNEIIKLLRKIPKKDHIAIKTVMARLFLRSFEGLSIKKLTGYKNYYRARVGSYRIIYEDDGAHVWIYSVKRRNESTYDDF